MYRFKKDIWKAGIAVAGLLLLLVFMVWFPVSAGANERGSGFATPVITVTLQATPTVDATMTILQKEQLTLQVKQLQNQKSWLENNSTALIAAVATVVVALFGITQWAINRRDERRKEIAAQDKDLRAQAEERFQAAVTALGDQKESVQVGGAILLRSFLNKDDEKIYGRYYTQIFDLAVAYLRLSNTSQPSEDPSGIPPSPKDSKAPLPLTPLRQALIVVFKEAFPLVRDMVKKQEAQFRLQSLDASRIQLDSSYLDKADLKQAFIQHASLKKVHLRGADLSDANLIRSDLSEANISEAKLIHAYLGATRLMKVILNQADLREAYLTAADLSDAILRESNLSGAHLGSAKLIRVDLSEADLSEANPEDAQTLEGTDLRGVIGMTKKQLEACKEKGAIIDEDIMTSSS